MSKPETDILLVYIDTPTERLYVKDWHAWGCEELSIIPEVWTTDMEAAGRIDYDSAAALIDDFRKGCIADVVRVDTGGTVLLHPERLPGSVVVGHWDGA